MDRDVGMELRPLGARALPPGVPARGWLDRYVSEFDTVELNASFYRWPRDASFASWRRRLPEGFRMSVKAPRGLTHAKKLYDPEVSANRIADSWHRLYDRRTVLLVQLPPKMERDDARLDWFRRRGGRSGLGGDGKSDPVLSPPARTMQDVADRVQVSKTAVSLAFNNPHELSEETLNKILQAAAELGYTRPNRTHAAHSPN